MNYLQLDRITQGILKHLPIRDRFPGVSGVAQSGEVGHELSGHFFLVYADAPKQAGIAVENPAIPVMHSHWKWHHIKQRAEPGLAFPQDRLGPLALGDVAALGNDQRDFTVLVKGRFERE